MTNTKENLKGWINHIAMLIETHQNLEAEHYTHFIEEPELALHLVDFIAALDELEADQEHTYYSACIFGLEICVAQLQSATDAQNKLAAKALKTLMSHMASTMMKRKHSLGFWLPVLNAFYEVHVELSDELKNAYFDLAHEDTEAMPDQQSHLNSIRDLIEELSDLSPFDIAEHFFAQSYAMPPDFFQDLVADLYSIEEGHEIALLMLLHPKREVREVVVATFDALMDTITLSPLALARLQTIKHWYPELYHEHFDRWLKLQRKKGVVFLSDQLRSDKAQVDIKATEIDGSGAQGVFIALKSDRKNRLCGLLLKEGVGIKDVWMTPVIPAKDVARYYKEAFDESVMLRKVDVSYLQLMVNHFLNLTIEQGGIPNLHLLDIQEALGVQFKPEAIELSHTLEQLAVQVIPFTPERLEDALLQSKSWLKSKSFTQSWFLEHPEVDRLVNKHCTYVNGVKICQFDAAIKDILLQEASDHPMRWVFHFLWVSLWLKSKARKNERMWQDCILIAYAIAQGRSLGDIPIMQEIARHTVMNSIETMHQRRTYLA